jgi:hypothetical protein
MLGRLRMSIEEAKNAYTRLSEAMFGKQLTLLLRAVQGGRYDERVFVAIVRDMIKAATGDGAQALRSDDGEGCKV